MAPLTPNGVIVAYRLRFRLVGGAWTTLLDGMSLSFELSPLLPYTEYELQLAVVTVGGVGFSSTTSFRTLESSELFYLLVFHSTHSNLRIFYFMLCYFILFYFIYTSFVLFTHSRSISAPSGQNAPSVSSIASTSAQVTWPQVTTPNGIIVSYNLYIAGDLYSSGLDMATTVTNLQPYTTYAVTVTACTAVGCTSSPTVSFRTAEAGNRIFCAI